MGWCKSLKHREDNGASKGLAGATEEEIRKREKPKKDEIDEKDKEEETNKEDEEVTTQNPSRSRSKDIWIAIAATRIQLTARKRSNYSYRP